MDVSGNGGGHPPSRRPESRVAMPPKSTSPSASSMTTRSPSTVTTAVATTREAPERFLGLSPAQVIASALAAATSALAASFLGVAGTIVGAVVGSMVATIGSAVYAHSLRRAHSQLRIVRLQPVTRQASTRALVVEGPESEQAREAEPETELAHSLRPAGERRGRRWAALAAAVVVAAALALGAITAAEALIGHPVSDASTSGTTLRHAFQGSPAPAPAPAPASGQGSTSKVPNPTSTATSGAVPGASPTGSATSPDAPAATESTLAPVAPTATATDTTTEAPQPLDGAPATGGPATP